MASAAPLRNRPHAALALDRLDDDRRGVGRDGGGEGRGIGRIDEGHAGNQRLERRAIVIVPGDRQRAHRPAVERVRRSATNFGARRALRVPEAARELQARLDRLRAAVAEERARQPRERPTGASPARPAAGGSTGSTCAAASSLLRDRARQHRMGVAERGDADAGDEVEIALARVRRTVRSPRRGRRPPARAGRPAARAGRRERSDREKWSSTIVS